MSFLLGYLLLGIGFYIGMVLNNHKTFIGAPTSSVINGLLLGLVFWPIGMVVKLIMVIVPIMNSEK